MLPKVIGVGSQKQHGKGELSKYLAGRLGWGVASFAGPVKRIFCDTFGVDLEFIERWKEVAAPPPGMLIPVRQALQFIGDGFRRIDGDIWIKLAFREEDSYARRIFDDERYPNEARSVRAHGGFNFLIYRPGWLNQDSNGSEAQVRPYLEWCRNTRREGIIRDWPEYREALGRESGPSGFLDDLACFDYFICNDGTVEDLHRKVDRDVLPLFAA